MVDISKWWNYIPKKAGKGVSKNEKTNETEWKKHWKRAQTNF